MHPFGHLRFRACRIVIQRLILIQETFKTLQPICCWVIYAVSYVKVALVLLWALSAAKARRSERSSASFRSMSEPVSFSSADSLPAGSVPSNPGGRYH